MAPDETPRSAASFLGLFCCQCRIKEGQAYISLCFGKAHSNPYKGFWVDIHDIVGKGINDK